MQVLIPLLTKIQNIAMAQKAICEKAKCLPRHWGRSSLKQNGYSLATVMILGAVTSMWVGALMATLVPTYERMTLIKGRNMARCSAEAGLDYVVGNLNSNISSADNGLTTSTYDASATGTTNYTKLTQSLIGNMGANVVVGVTNYAPQSNCTLYTSALPTSPNPWRMVDAYAALGSYYKHIRLILEPIVVYSVVYGNNTVQNPTPSFPYALFGNVQVDSIGMVSITSYNNPSGKYTQWNADTGSNQTVNELGTGNMSRAVLEGGNHLELATPAQTHLPGTQFTFNNGMGGTVVASAPWLQIGNNVYSNNNTDGYNPGLDPQAPTFPTSPNQNNVLGINNPPTSGTSPPGGTVTEYQSYPMANIPPAPTAPTGTFVQASGGQPGSGSANAGSINLSNGAKLVISDSATTVPTSLTASNSTITVPPGNYVVNGITLNDTSSIINNSSSPTQIYIQGNVPGTTAVSISNTASINMQASASPGNDANMQIYYNGSKDVDLDGQISAVVYAPNAVNVYIGQGLTNPTLYYGAVVGGNIYLNGGLYGGGGVQFNYDYNLKPANPNELSGGSVMTYGTTTVTTTTTTLKITGFKGVSWYEVHDGPHFSPTQWTTWPSQVNSLLGL
jgi:hypothetical protein